MKRICGLLALIMLLSSCGTQASPSVTAGFSQIRQEPSVEFHTTPITEPSVYTPPYPAELPEVSPEEDPMIDRTFKGVSFQIRYSWEERVASDGAVTFSPDPSCVIMLQQLEHDGDTHVEDLLSPVMEALAPGAAHQEFIKDGFQAMSCQYVRQIDGKNIQCISYSYAHGKMLTTITILLEGSYMDAAESTLRPILDTLALTSV